MAGERRSNNFMAEFGLLLRTFFLANAKLNKQKVYVLGETKHVRVISKQVFI